MNDYGYADATCLTYFSTLAPVYDAAMPGLDGDVAFYTRLAKEAGSPVLELACGTGRIALPIAEAGIEIVGIDRTPAMLSIARERLFDMDAAIKERVTFVEDDMREFQLDERFTLAMIPYRSFVLLLTSDDQRAALEHIRDHLVDGGRLVFDTFDPNLSVLAKFMGESANTVHRKGEYPLPHGGRLVVWYSRRVDPVTQLIHEEEIIEELDTAGVVRSQRHAPRVMRYSYRYETEYLLRLCGFEIEALEGGFRGEPFRHGNAQVWTARKR